MRDLQELIDTEDYQELELAVSSLQEALFGLNRRLSAEKRSDSNP